MKLNFAIQSKKRLYTRQLQCFPPLCTRESKSCQLASQTSP